MKRNLILSACLTAGALATVSAARAQGPEELLLFSRQNFGLATARTAGMGGAFTSLGADGASMSLNPAGMAMYSRSELALSPGLRISAQKADYRTPNGNLDKHLNRVKANIGNFSMVYTGNNFAIGFGMNRLADFNGRSRAISFNDRKALGEGFSIGDMFVEQLYGIPASTIGAPEKDIYKAFYDYPPALWGAIMGYQAGLFDPVAGTGGDGQPPQQYTTRGMIQEGTLLFPEWYRRTAGAINEYTISGGYNFKDIFYIGATLGIQDIYYSRVDTYSEITSANNVGLLSTYYNQAYDLSGVGVNLKVGATVRPVPWLRIGVAYHSPTWIGMTDEYAADMTVNYTHSIGGYDYGFSDTPIQRQEYRMRTPSRLMAGVSATIGTVGIVSVDYERTWYQHMKYTSDDYRDINTGIGETYGPTDVIRAGVEFQPARSLFLRAGYGYSTSVYRDDAYASFGEYQQISGGIGFRNRSVSVDLAYVYGKANGMPYKPFDYTSEDGYRVATEGTIYTKERYHNVILTMAFRF